MDEELEAALMRAGQQIEQLQRQVVALRAERDQARARVDSAVSLLTSIHACQQAARCMRLRSAWRR